MRWVESKGLFINRLRRPSDPGKVRPIFGAASALSRGNQRGRKTLSNDLHSLRFSTIPENPFLCMERLLASPFLTSPTKLASFTNGPSNGAIFIFARGHCSGTKQNLKSQSTLRTADEDAEKPVAARQMAGSSDTLPDIHDANTESFLPLLHNVCDAIDRWRPRTATSRRICPIRNDAAGFTGAERQLFSAIAGRTERD